jgi:hypothetical protein
MQRLVLTVDLHAGQRRGYQERPSVPPSLKISIPYDMVIQPGLAHSMLRKAMDFPQSRRSHDR